MCKNINNNNKKYLEQGVHLVNGIVSAAGGDPDLINEMPYDTFAKPGDDRAFYRKAGNLINWHGPDNSVTVAIHEMMHGIEENIPGVLEACIEFWKYRVGDEHGTLMKDEFPKLKYGDREVGYKDNFDKAFGKHAGYYAGKVYKNAEGKITGTEILAVGVEQLYTDPTNFIRKDPEYAAFIMGVLNGKIRRKGIPQE